MVGKTTQSEIIDEQGNIFHQAVVVRKEVMFGNIRIRCPSDFTEHEIPADSKTFTCPIGGEKLFIIF